MTRERSSRWQTVRQESMELNTTLPYRPKDPSNATLGDYELSPTSHMIVGGCLLFIGSLGVIGNVFFILGLLKFRRKRTYHEGFLINLAITDTGVCLTGYPWAAASSFAQRWIFGDTGCQWYGFCGFFFGVASITTLAVISFDRFTTICLQNTNYHINNRNKLKGVLAMIWLYSLFWALMPVLGWGQYALEPFKTSCTLDWHAGGVGGYELVICLFVCIIGLNVLVISCSYGGIVFTLKKRRKQVVPGLNTPSMASQRAERKTTLVSFVIVLAFLICWLPYGVFSVVYALGNHGDVSVEVTVIPALMAKSSSFLNPIIYAVASRKYRKILFACLCRGHVSVINPTPVPPVIQNTHARNALTPISQAGLTPASSPPQTRNPQAIFVVEYGSNVANTYSGQNESSKRLTISTRLPSTHSAVEGEAVSNFHSIQSATEVNI